MCMPMTESKFKFLRELHEKHYKPLMLVTVALLILSIVILGVTKITTGDFVYKDVSLSGGLAISIQTQEDFSLADLEKQIESKTDLSVHITSLRSAGSSQIVGYSFEFASQDPEICKSAVSDATGIALAEGMYSIDQTSPTLGASFFSGMIKALLIAFVFMSIVVFLFFRVPVPSVAVILAAVSDVLGTLAIMNLFNIRLSTAGVAALLLLVGYSVDTDILLSAKVLKSRDGSLTDRIASAFKTGITMQSTSIIALIALYLATPAPTLKAFATVAIIGLALDMINTWIQNVGILRWYVEQKNGQA